MLALAAGVAFTSCEDKLDEPQKGVTDMAAFYKTDADFQKALTSCYHGFLVETMVTRGKRFLKVCISLIKSAYLLLPWFPC